MQRLLIVGAAIGLWLLGLLIEDRGSGWVQTAFGVLAFATIAGLIVYLVLRGSGWRRLARQYPENVPYTGELRRCRTFQMIALDLDEAFPTRFSGGIVRVGVAPDALYVVAPSVVRSLLPTIRLPWGAIASAKPFEAPGWVNPVAQAGTAFQVAYDPGFRGEFIELETTAPKTCIRLPGYAIEGARGNLPSG